MNDRVTVMRRDILSGPITRSMVRLAWPVAASNVLQTAFGIIDAIWVGHLGPEALAGVSTAGFVVWALFALIGMVSVGVNALVARRIGAQEHDEAARIVGQGLSFAIMVGLVLAIATYFSLDTLFRFMQTDDAVTGQGKLYLGTIALSLPVIFAFSAVNAAFAGAGDTRTTLWLSGGTVVLAGILDPFLIYGLGPVPRLGVQGAALATVISRVVFLGVGIWMLFSNRTGIGIAFPRFAPDRTIYSRIVKIGAPTSVAGIINSVVFVALTRITTTFGTPAVAALGVCHRLEGINYLLGVGFAAAASAFVGQNLGANQPDRAEHGAWRACLLDLLPVSLLALVFFTIPEILLSAFTNDPEVIAAGASYLRIVAIAQLFQGFELVLDGAFGGAGNTVPPMLIAIPSSLARYPLALFFTGVLGMPVSGVWWAISITTVFRGSAVAYWFSLGRWKSVRI